MKHKSDTVLYGFDDFKTIKLSQRALFSDYGWYLNYYNDLCTYLTVDSTLQAKMFSDSSYTSNVATKQTLCEDHPELLNTASKLFVHPTCKLSRTMLAQKYGKSLNPWFADAVVIPAFYKWIINTQHVVIFANYEAKLIVIIDILNDKIEASNSFQLEQSFESLAKSAPIRTSYASGYSYEDVLKSQIIYIGNCFKIPHSDSYILDILTGTIPASKIVFEKTVQKSLSTDDNQLSLESLVNIHDMLESSDENTVGAGLKALSMMDYIHYPNSIRFVLKNIYKGNYIYNKATNSTSVKFMFKQLTNSSRRSAFPGNYDYAIYEQDFELLKQLIKHYEPSYGASVLDYMRHISFMTVNDDGVLVPRLKSS